MKHKALICAHGGQDIFGVNYVDAYFPGVNLIFIRLLLMICHHYKLESESIHFVLAFPQADFDGDMCVKISRNGSRRNI